MIAPVEGAAQPGVQQAAPHGGAGPVQEFRQGPCSRAQRPCDRTNVSLSFHTNVPMP